MILLCGGQSRTVNQDRDDQPIRIYPTVLAYFDEDDPNYLQQLQAILPTVVEPFVVRLLDKDLAKLPRK